MATVNVLGTSTTNRAAMPSPAQGHASVRLADGRILVVGGVYAADMAVTRIYTPSTNTWTTGANMPAARSYGVMCLLDDGRALYMGGSNSDVESVDVYAYDPVGNSWSTLAPMPEVQFGCSATTLQNGKVIVAGGVDSGGTAFRLNALEYDPDTNVWTRRAYHPVTSVNAKAPASVTLPNGKVLVMAGGATGQSSYYYDPVTDSWSDTVGSPFVGSFGAAVMLDNGVTCLVGGRTVDHYAANKLQFFDYTSESWTSVDQTIAMDRSACAWLSADDQLLVFGQDGTYDKTLEVSLQIVDNVTPTAWVDNPGGAYVDSVTITISTSEPATIYYTLDGSDPTGGSAVYSSPIVIAADTVLKFFAEDAAFNASPIYTETYDIASNSGAVANNEEDDMIELVYNTDSVLAFSLTLADGSPDTGSITSVFLHKPDNTISSPVPLHAPIGSGLHKLTLAAGDVPSPGRYTLMVKSDSANAAWRVMHLMVVPDATYVRLWDIQTSADDAALAAGDIFNTMKASRVMRKDDALGWVVDVYYPGQIVGSDPPLFTKQLLDKDGSPITDPAAGAVAQELEVVIAG